MLLPCININSGRARCCTGNTSQNMEQLPIMHRVVNSHPSSFAVWDIQNGTTRHSMEHVGTSMLAL